MKRPVYWFMLLICGLMQSCASSPEVLTVAVAANLLAPMEEVVAAYERMSGHSVHLVSASSGVLTAQITEGAPFDVFFSANERYPQQLVRAGLTREPPRTIVRGQLVCWSQQPIPAAGPAALFQASPERIALAQVDLAPYGAAARAWLKQQQLWDALQDRLVFGENVGQVNRYIYARSVDVAFTGNSALHAPELRDIGHWALVPDAPSIPHAAVLLNGSRHRQASEFWLFLHSSSEARQVFQQYGYLPPE